MADRLQALSNTQRAYRKEAERFLLWAITNQPGTLLRGGSACLHTEQLSTSGVCWGENSGAELSTAAGVRRLRRNGERCKNTGVCPSIGTSQCLQQRDGRELLRNPRVRVDRLST